MKIVYLVAGAGGMYCGSCLHANSLATAVGDAGVDFRLVPVYTPVRTDEENVSEDRVLYGGLNVCLQHKWKLFRHTPSLLDRLFDSPWLLRLLGRFGSSTSPAKLGPLTISMLQADEGPLARESEKLVDWIAREAQPDVIHLSNVMLAGLARQMVAKLDVPVVCSLTGEDVFLESLPGKHRDQAVSLLSERCGDLTTMIALNRYYGDFMADYLSVDRRRIEVIRPGLNLAGYPPQDDSDHSPAERMATIGFLSRVCSEKGLHDLVEAWFALDDDQDVPPVRLVVAGYLSSADRRYLRKLEKRISDRGLADRFEYVGSPDHDRKVAMLGSIDLLCIPSTIGESKALPVLEAWAVSRPVVLPDRGVYRELVEETGGGLLYDPTNPAELVDRLKQLILDREMARNLGRAGRAAIVERHDARVMAQSTIELYRKILANRKV